MKLFSNPVNAWAQTACPPYLADFHLASLSLGNFGGGIELGGQFRQGLATLHGRQGHLGPKGRGVATTGTSVHVVLHVAGADHAPIG